MISVIIPTYNEKDRIVKCIAETKKALGNCQIIISDDGSNDKSYPDIADLNVVVICSCFNKGKGETLRQAIQYCKGDYIAFLDGDMEIHPKYLAQFYKHKQADIVIGTKYSKKSKVHNNRRRRVVSYGYYFLTKILFNLPCRDTQTGIKLFKREVLINTFKYLTVRKFAFDLELLVMANYLGYTIQEEPIVIGKKTKDRISLMNIFDTLKDTILIWLRLQVVKFYDCIYHNPNKRMGR